MYQIYLSVTWKNSKHKDKLYKLLENSKKKGISFSIFGESGQPEFSSISLSKKHSIGEEMKNAKVILFPEGAYVDNKEAIDSEMNFAADFGIVKIVVSEELNNRKDYELYENETDINCSFEDESFWGAIDEGCFIFPI